VMAATSRANSAKMEYNLAASENRDAMAPPKMGKDLQFSCIGTPEWIG